MAEVRICLPAGYHLREMSGGTEPGRRNLLEMHIDAEFAADDLELAAGRNGESYCSRCAELDAIGRGHRIRVGDGEGVALG